MRIGKTEINKDIVLNFFKWRIKINELVIKNKKESEIPGFKTYTAWDKNRSKYAVLNTNGLKTAKSRAVPVTAQLKYKSNFNNKDGFILSERKNKKIVSGVSPISKYWASSLCHPAVKKL